MPDYINVTYYHKALDDTMYFEKRDDKIYQVHKDLPDFECANYTWDSLNAFMEENGFEQTRVTWMFEFNSSSIPMETIKVKAESRKLDTKWELQTPEPEAPIYKPPQAVTHLQNELNISELQPEAPNIGDTNGRQQSSKVIAPKAR
jgi:hypothetical protein